MPKISGGDDAGFAFEFLDEDTFVAAAGRGAGLDRIERIGIEFEPRRHGSVLGRAIAGNIGVPVHILQAQLASSRRGLIDDGIVGGGQMRQLVRREKLGDVPRAVGAQVVANPGGDTRQFFQVVVLCRDDVGTRLHVPSSAARLIEPSTWSMVLTGQMSL